MRNIYEEGEGTQKELQEEKEQKKNDIGTVVMCGLVWILKVPYNIKYKLNILIYF